MRKLKTSLDLIALRSNRKDILPKVAQSPENTKKQKEIRKVYNNKFTIPLLTKLNTSHDRSLSMDGRKFNTNVSHSRSNSKTMTPRISNPITPRTYNDGTMSRASNVTNKSRKYTTPLKKDQQLIEKFKTVIPNITTIEAKSPRTRIDYLIFTPINPIYTTPFKSKTQRSSEVYYYRFMNGDTPIIKTILSQHNFQEALPNCYVTLTWVCGTVKPEIYPTLNYYEKINHFPKSFNITRKDLLHRNISKMQILHGLTYFDFIPKSFILPLEFFLLEEDFEKNKGEMWYIVKPQASSQGKGIYVTDRLDRIAEKRDAQLIVSHYIKDPYLINGLKFDLRIYVALTSIHPLRIYMYEEGLVRFATDPYSTDLENQSNHINKFSEKFIKSDGTIKEEASSKWSLKTFRQYLESKKINPNDVFARIEDVIIKTIISMESIVFQATCAHVPNRYNCFDLFGFDILLDSALKPWLLEVNLSPSLACESPLDTKIKSELIADLFNLVGIVPLGQRTHSHLNKFGEPHSYFKSPSALSPFEAKKKSMSIIIPEARTFEAMTKEEKTIIYETNEEWGRRGNFKRIYPNLNSYEYKNYFEQDRPYNKLLRELVSFNVKKVTSTATSPTKVPIAKTEVKTSPRYVSPLLKNQALNQRYTTSPRNNIRGGAKYPPIKEKSSPRFGSSPKNFGSSPKTLGTSPKNLNRSNSPNPKFSFPEKYAKRLNSKSNPNMMAIKSQLVPFKKEVRTSPRSLLNQNSRAIKIL